MVRAVRQFKTKSAKRISYRKPSRHRGPGAFDERSAAALNRLETSLARNARTEIVRKVQAVGKNAS